MPESDGTPSRAVILALRRASMVPAVEAGPIATIRRSGSGSRAILAP
jgi:hypothetical protein